MTKGAEHIQFMFRLIHANEVGTETLVDAYAVMFGSVWRVAYFYHNTLMPVDESILWQLPYNSATSVVTLSEITQSDVTASSHGISVVVGHPNFVVITTPITR